MRIWFVATLPLFAYVYKRKARESVHATRLALEGLRIAQYSRRATQKPTHKYVQSP